MILLSLFVTNSLITPPLSLVISITSTERVTQTNHKGHGFTVVTHLPSTSEIGVPILVQPQVGKLVVAYPWWVICSTGP